MKDQTPAYVFDVDEFHKRVSFVKSYLNEIPLTYSIKANPFLLHEMSDDLRYVEVCSPGELAICKKANVDGSRIIYSGVNKEETDVYEAIAYGVSIVTAESLKHVRIVNEISCNLSMKQRVILRVTSGNQFGMSKEDITYVMAHRDMFSSIDLYGIHYYSGTQKKTKKIEKDLNFLDELLCELYKEYGFEAKFVEYGPGLSVEYFKDTYDADEVSYLEDFVQCLKEFSLKYPVGIEMGRYLACSCGSYYTKVMDLKKNDGVNYVILDGGIHQIQYYGQSMAMKIPPIEVIGGDDCECESYCLCGSLCTTADVLVREVSLPILKEGSVICLKRCGAYSITENTALFLSRQLPKVFLYSVKNRCIMVRDVVASSDLNY